MKKILFGLLLITNLFALDGNKFVSFMKEYKKENNKNWVDAFAFMYYIEGINDTLKGILICYPSNVNNGQIASIVIKYIENNPEKWNHSAYSLVTTPLIKTFPCKKKK